MHILKALAVTYDPTQDRILTVINPSQTDTWSCWMTRRMVLGVLQKTPPIVAASSPMIKKAPLDYRNDLAVFEREAAIVTTAHSMTQTPQNVMKTSAVSAELADRLTITSQGENFKLEIYGDQGGSAAGIVGRADFQRILQMLEVEVAKAVWSGATGEAAPSLISDPPLSNPVRH